MSLNPGLVSFVQRQQILFDVDIYVASQLETHLD